MNRYTVTLTEDERESLRELTSKGKHNSQQILNTLILLNCDKSEWNVNHSINEEISRVLNISMKKIDRLRGDLLKKASKLPSTGKKTIAFILKKLMVILKLILSLLVAVNLPKVLQDGL